MAAAAAPRNKGAKFVAGGTNLLDLMKLQIETPAHLISVFADEQIRSDTRSMSLADAAGVAGLVAEDFIEYGDLDKKFQQSTFGAHFVEVGVDEATGETRVRRMLAVCAAGRILNPKTARSQIIGAMTMLQYPTIIIAYYIQLWWGGWADATKPGRSEFVCGVRDHLCQAQPDPCSGSIVHLPACGK